MKKRTLIFRAGDDVRVTGQGWTVDDTRLFSYKTADYGWTLTGCTLSDPEQKTQFVEKAGGDGSWDLSTALTNGIPQYKDRTLTATLELSEGTREERVRAVRKLVNLLDGFAWEIILPDQPDYFLKGRVRVAVNQNSLAYAMVTITATCEPWLYSERETVVVVTATSTMQQVFLWNDGRRAVSPNIIATGSGTLISIVDAKTQETKQMSFQPGTFRWPYFVLTPGANILFFTGSGTLTFTYREAVLL